MSEPAHLSALDAANLLAGHAVSYATAFLDGRHTAKQLADNTDRLLLDLLGVQQLEPNELLDPVRLLRCAMAWAARSAILEDDPTRLESWEKVMGSFVTLIQHESRKLRDQMTAAEGTGR